MRRALPYVVVFVLALAVRGWHLASIRELPIFEHPVGDARSYDEWGQRIARGDWFGEEVFYQAPLYPYFLGAFYALAGHDLTGVRVAQAVLGSLAAVLLARAGVRFFRDERAGLAAGFLAALHPMAIFFDGRIEKSSLDLFLLAAFLCLLARARSGGRRTASWFFAGAVLGLLCLTRENAATFVPVVAIGFVLSFRREGRSAVLGLGALGLGLVLALAPVAWRNHRLSGEVHLTTSQLGPNLYIGNHPGARGTYEPLFPGVSNTSYERFHAARAAEDALGRRPTPAEVSSYWTGRVIEYVRAEPLDWLALLARKAALLANDTEAVDTIDPYTVAESSAPLAVLLRILSFGVLAPMAVYGIAATWADRRRSGILIVLAATYAASVVAFYVLDRYRHPLAPFVVLFAGAGLARWLELARARARIPHADRAGIVLAVLLAALARWPIDVLDRDRLATVTRTNYGVVHAEQGRVDLAVGELRRALELEPSNAQAHYMLGIALEQSGDPEGALFHYAAAVRIAPHHAQARYNLAVRLEEDGRLDEAIRHYAAARRLDPWDLQAGANLARLLSFRGDFEGAIAEYRRMLELDPGAGPIRRSLGVVLLESGLPGEAVRELEFVLGADPRDWPSWIALGEAHAASGERDRAIEALERARALAPAAEAARIEARLAELAG